jgi:AraC-like DNA-binding protein
MLLTRIDTNGLDEAAEQITPIANVRYVQLEPGVARIHGVIAQLNSILVGRFSGDRNRIIRAETVPGKLTFFVPLRGVARLGTTTVQLEHAVVVSRAAQLIAFADRDFLPLSISVDLYRCKEVAADLRTEIQFPSDAIGMRHVSAAQALALDRMARGLFDLTAAADPASTECVSALEETVLRWCLTLLQGEQALLRPADNAASRRRAVLRAREFIDSHLDQPLSLPLICRASYCSARALEYGFREMFGVAPMTYTRCARLSRVRCDLYLSEPRPKTVTRLAMKWGFQHLGQFSKDYRTLFCESPSVTLARHCQASGRRALWANRAERRIDRPCAKLIAALDASH